MTAAEKTLGPVGWKLMNPEGDLQDVLARGYRSWRFERYVGKSRIAMVILIAKSRASAWTTLRRQLRADEEAA